MRHSSASALEPRRPPGVVRSHPPAGCFPTHRQQHAAMGMAARGSRLWVRLQSIAFPARNEVTPRLTGFQCFGPMRMCSTASATASPCASCTVIVTGQSCFRCQSDGGVKWQTAVRSVRALRR